MTAAKNDDDNKYYYKFDVANLPDELYADAVPVEKWLRNCTTAPRRGFAENSLNQLSPVSWEIQVERCCGVSLYLMFNVLPFVLPLLVILAYFYAFAGYILVFLVVYFLVLFLPLNYYFKPRFLKKYKRTGTLGSNIKDNQYLYTERNITKLLSVNFVWPRTVHRPALDDQACIFVAIPHAVAPMGITAYPLWSKLWNDKLCHWACAPVLFQLPLVGYFLKKIGFIAAKAPDILTTLTKKQENVGVILDGIMGMFQPHGQEEFAYLQQRKGIVKIALKAGAPLIPVYGFGHTALYTVFVDPFGILKYLSGHLEMSLVPFVGRFGWFLGPPYRIPITVCLGEPVMCPQMENPTKQEIDKYHAQLLSSFEQLFEKHKAAYGWGHKKLVFV